MECAGDRGWEGEEEGRQAGVVEEGGQIEGGKGDRQLGER